MAVSVTGRAERPLTKRFDELNIDWSVVERKLLAWSELFRKGKQLRVDICIRYAESDSSTTMNSQRTKTKRAKMSATEHMLGERAAQLDAEQATTGQPSTWRDTYALFRCPGPPCALGPWCWHDSQTIRRYKLKAHHLRALVRHVESGKPLRTHDDVPDDLRQHVY